MHNPHSTFVGTGSSLLSLTPQSKRTAQSIRHFCRDGELPAESNTAQRTQSTQYFCREGKLSAESNTAQQSTIHTALLQGWGALCWVKQRTANAQPTWSTQHFCRDGELPTESNTHSKRTIHTALLRGRASSLLSLTPHSKRTDHTALLWGWGAHCCSCSLVLGGCYAALSASRGCWAVLPTLCQYQVTHQRFQHWILEQSFKQQKSYDYQRRTRISDLASRYNLEVANARELEETETLRVNLKSFYENSEGGIRGSPMEMWLMDVPGFCQHKR